MPFLMRKGELWINLDRMLSFHSEKEGEAESFQFFSPTARVDEPVETLEYAMPVKYVFCL